MVALRRRRALIAWIAMLALVGNVAAGLFCSASQNRDRFGAADDLLGTLIICSAHGEQSQPDDAVPTPAKPCQICITVASVTLVVALAAIALSIPLSTTPIAFSPVPAFACAARRGAHRSRAPPLPA